MFIQLLINIPSKCRSEKQRICASSWVVFRARLQVSAGVCQTVYIPCWPHCLSRDLQHADKLMQNISQKPVDLIPILLRHTVCCSKILQRFTDEFVTFWHAVTALTGAFTSTLNPRYNVPQYNVDSVTAWLKSWIPPYFTGLAKAGYKQDVCSKCPLNDWRTQC